jgi:hypothetical protein
MYNTEEYYERNRKYDNGSKKMSYEEKAIATKLA